MPAEQMPPDLTGAVVSVEASGRPVAEGPVASPIAGWSSPPVGDEHAPAGQ